MNFQDLNQIFVEFHTFLPMSMDFTIFAAFLDLNNVLKQNACLSGPRTKPNKTGPNQTKPDQTRPNQTKPDQTRQNQTKPDQTNATMTISIPNLDAGHWSIHHDDGL